MLSANEKLGGWIANGALAAPPRPQDLNAGLVGPVWLPLCSSGHDFSRAV